MVDSVLLELVDVVDGSLEVVFFPGDAKKQDVNNPKEDINNKYLANFFINETNFNNLLYNKM